jgi:aminoglycoside/choline kinase family phosphotransferase
MESMEGLPKPWIRERALAGDASCRQYARIWDRHDHSAILARYPKRVRNQMARDFEVRTWCAMRGLRVPSLLDHDVDAGWAVFEDFGPDDAEASLENTPAGERRSLARQLLVPLTSLGRVQPSDLPPWNPPLDGTRLRWELAGFELWFLRHRLEVTPSPTVGRWLDKLADAIGAHPQRVCHRDYHLNNLFFLADGAVGLIDYQDILVGPDTYDAVSLLCERGLPQLIEDDERERIRVTWAQDADVRPGWQERWSLVRAQRALKVLGTFARLTARGAQAYEPWMHALLGQIAPKLANLHAPSELVNLLLDLSRRHQLGQDRKGHEAAPA